MTDAAVILVDVSGSMAALEGSRRRVDILTDILRQVLPGAPGARVIAFSSLPQELLGIEPVQLHLPEPAGGTALHLALQGLADGPRPDRIVVITDGQVDDPGAALSAARRLAPVTIDTFYCGSDGDARALGFLRALSLAGGTGRGITGPRSLTQAAALAAELRLRLAGPAR